MLSLNYSPKLFRICLGSAIITLTGLVFFWSRRPSRNMMYDLHFNSEAEQSAEVALTTGNRYVKFKQLNGIGFNNQAQEVLLYHHLALESNRIYVYQPLSWLPRNNEQVPLSAFLAGPTAGSINEAHFHKVCSWRDVVHIKLATNSRSQWNHAKQVLRGGERCIVVDDWIMTWDFLASPDFSNIWGSFQEYLKKHFEWSLPIKYIADRTQRKLGLLPARGGEPYMALHLRRGDFEGHCPGLARKQLGFTTWASLPILLPSILGPPFNRTDPVSVVQHCYPSLDRIFEAITVQARRNPHIHRLHILHDAMDERQYNDLVTKLKDPAQTARAGWTGGPMQAITQSSDIPIQKCERDWEVCLDEEIGRRAAVFIGNGYSSLSSQIIALRLGADRGNVEDVMLY
ncbi:hypothetical protein CPB83DRAFT_864130 [Crepidotus variabilis]|uniref:O-fucosyltransferase family protein n=1 Tax=Crepidotus variabilis TaxID=179855 RepID=A0A9P6E508_9AGAR|nr:hypothetical protein CPB83DRAFT_864130 [Crepidotus variabilis]